MLKALRDRLSRLPARWRPRLWAAFVLISHGAGALSSVQAVMETRTSQGAIAWVVSLNTFPYLAVPAYWVFGRSEFQGYITARRQELMETHPAAVSYVETLLSEKLVAFPGRDEALLVEKLAKLPYTQGNEVELLVDGEATFDSILAGIDRARDYVLVQFYILRDDQIGRALQARLIAQARAGCRCYVLYDEIGSSDLPKRYVEELRAAGVAVAAFHSTRGDANRFQINFRNHRKIVIVDGREAWVGGLNVGDEYLGRNPAFGDWRDTHLRVLGPAVPGIQVAFAEDWHWATDQVPEWHWKPERAPSGASVPVLSLPTGPVDKLETCTLFFVDLINRTKKRLWIASPYFVPDEQFITALKLAALRGVEVRVLMPDQTDNFLVQYTGWSYLEELDGAGIEVWRHQKGFMHQKVIVADDVCTIGTANFDNRSFRLNFEITLEIADAAFTGQVAAMLENDFAHAVRARPADLQARGSFFRFLTRACRLLAPIQ